MIREGFVKLIRWAARQRAMADDQNEALDQCESLSPLTPQYLEVEHAVYVSALEEALENTEVRNIALSGSYGVGKSSILRQLTTRLQGRVIEISLSTLAPTARDPDGAVTDQNSTQTNRVQQEIVKQLLYRERPSNTPASRFHRIEPFNCKRNALASMTIGFVIALVFLLAGWTERLSNVLKNNEISELRITLLISLFATFFVYLTFYILHGKLRIKELKAGPATVALDENSSSYFDQYLDEIVYLFQRSKCDVVIFEDIDRFDDAYIFETLKALNSVLNAAPDIKKVIRFVYAIRDSIFDASELAKQGYVMPGVEQAAEAQVEPEIVRANRTKFFDLVIPVVPFITHASARDLASQILKGVEHNVNVKLLDIAAQHVPDMRLLKNVCNEFIVFRNRIIFSRGNELGLNESELFAMMLYKSTHLADFEKIRLGTSHLDEVYRYSRKLVADNIDRTESERQKLAQCLGQLCEIESRAEDLGMRLEKYVDRVADAAGIGKYYEQWHFTYMGESVETLRSVNFWEQFASASEEHKLTCEGGYSNELKFSRRNISEELRDSLDVDSWRVAGHDELKAQIDAKAKEIDFLRGADFEELFQRSDYILSNGESEVSFAAFVQEHLKSGLACDMLRAGYITHNFILYTSVFHADRVSQCAMNFMIHSIERNVMDVHYVLDNEDVESILSKYGEYRMRESAFYNIAILDYLLDCHRDVADVMIESLDLQGDRQLEFLQAYLKVGSQPESLIERLTALSSWSLDYVVNRVDLGERERVKLVDVILNHLSTMEQHVDSAIADFLSTKYRSFPSLTLGVKDPQAERIGELFERASVNLVSLSPLAEPVRRHFISRNLYAITHENLVTVIGNSSESVALDVLEASDPNAYEYVLGHLEEYLREVDGYSVTIDDPQRFVGMLGRLVQLQTPSLEEVIRRAAPSCQIQDLGEVSEEVWQALARHRRFPATCGNIRRYWDVYEVDEELAGLLKRAGSITEADAIQEGEKKKLALAILATDEEWLTSKERAELVKSLSLASALEVDRIRPEKGQLFALLLEYEIIGDEPASYRRLAATDWPTRRAFICASSTFGDYMTPELVSDDLLDILSDSEIVDEIKRQILKDVEMYAVGADSKVLNEIARLAVQYETMIPVPVIEIMAESNVPAPDVVVLLHPHLQDLVDQDLFRILEYVGGDYAKLTDIGNGALFIPNTDKVVDLFERLKDCGTVSSYDLKEKDYRVNLKRKRKSH